MNPNNNQQTNPELIAKLEKLKNLKMLLAMGQSGALDEGSIANSYMSFMNQGQDDTSEKMAFAQALGGTNPEMASGIMSDIGKSKGWLQNDNSGSEDDLIMQARTLANNKAELEQLKSTLGSSSPVYKALKNRMESEENDLIQAQGLSTDRSSPTLSKASKGYGIIADKTDKLKYVPFLSGVPEFAKATSNVMKGDFGGGLKNALMGTLGTMTPLPAAYNIGKGLFNKWRK